MADEEARQRDALYERAERLASALAAIGDSLREAVADVNAGKAPSRSSPGRKHSSRVPILTWYLLIPILLSPAS